MPRLEAESRRLKAELQTEREYVAELSTVDPSHVAELQTAIEEQTFVLARSHKAYSSFCSVIINSWKEKVASLTEELAIIKSQVEMKTNAFNEAQAKIASNNARFETVKGHTVDEAHRRKGASQQEGQSCC